MVEKILKIENESGIHMRPASELVKLTGSCGSEVIIVHNGKEINAKSILNVMAAGIKCGDEITLRCIGDTETQDLETIVKGIEAGLE